MASTTTQPPTTTSQHEEHIKSEFQVLIDNFTNLIKAAKPRDQSYTDQNSAPGELLEVFTEKMLASCRSLLSIITDLKRNALLNDVATRNAEVRAIRRRDDGMDVD